MSAVKNLFFDELQRSVAPGLPSFSTPSLRTVFILTMNGKPLSVYSNPKTAERDMATMQEGDARDGYQSTYTIKEMRIDYT